MTDFNQEFADVLERVERPGSFAVSGSFDMHPPRLEIEGLGPIALPLMPEQAARLVAIAEQAPYGRGTETLVDTQVRRTWQLDATRVRLTGRHWSDDLAKVVESVRRGLGVAASIEAQLYKLLVYDTGSFFVPHRDTEKAPGMFATLVIVLPGDYSGGDLLIRHRGQEVRFDLHRDEPAEAAFAAFYADCVHEVLPIASGYRLALIYNLVRVGKGELPRPPDYDKEQDRLTRLLAAWDDSETAPDKLVYPLEHAYTQDQLDFAMLKGKDAAAAQLLVPAAAAARCDLYLALISISESGWAEYTGYGRRGDWDMEIGEVTDTEMSIHDWRLPDGGRPAMGDLPFDEDEVSPLAALADRDDTEPEFSEATGNAGASFERFYQRAAFVLWPRIRRSARLATGGLEVSMPALLDLVERWETTSPESAPEQRDTLGQEAQELAAAIRAAWPGEDWRRDQASKDGHARDLLAAGLRLDDLAGCVDFIRDQAASGAFGEVDNEILAEVFACVPEEQAAELFGLLIAGTVGRKPDTCLTLLDCVAERDAGLLGHLHTPAQALIDGLTRPSEPTPVVYGASERRKMSPEALARGIGALARIAPSLADTLIERLLANPTVADPDHLLLPTALLLKAAGATSELTAVTRLRQAVLAHLADRIALSLAPPSDWTRPSEVPCRCADCQALSRFLASPTEPIWRFKDVEAKRQHLTGSIQRANCDLDLSTDKRGRPYTLICTKNQASYERRARQRAQDLAHQAQLGG